MLHDDTRRLSAAPLYGFVTHRRFRHLKSAVWKKNLAFVLERSLPRRREQYPFCHEGFPLMPIDRSLGGPPSLLVLLALGVTAHVQAQGSVFKSTVEVVPLTVTVTDARGGT